MQILKTLRSCQLESLGRDGTRSSDASAGSPPRRLQDLVTPELTKLLRLVPAGLVAGVKDLAKEKIVETSNSRGGVQPQHAQQWRPSSLFCLACTVLLFINIPLLILLLFVFGPLVVALFVACVVPLGLANIALCLLRDNNKGCHRGHEDELSGSETCERQEVLEISNRLHRTHSYVSGLGTCAECAPDADSTALNTPPYSELAVPEFATSVGTFSSHLGIQRPFGKSLELLLSSLQKPLEGLCHWVQKMRPEISFKLSFKLAVQPTEGSFNSLLRYPRGSGYFYSKFAPGTCHEVLPTPSTLVELLEAESCDADSLIRTSSAYDDDTLDAQHQEQQEQQPTPPSKHSKHDQAHPSTSNETEPTSPSKHTKRDHAHPSTSNETAAPAAGATNLEAAVKAPIEGRVLGQHQPLPPLQYSPSLPAFMEDPQFRERRTSNSSRDAETNGIELRQLLASSHSQTRMTRLKQLLRMGADPNICNRTGATALHIAAWKGKGLEVMKLIEYGALVDVPDDCGLIPLHMAVWHRNLSAVSVLLQSGADVNALTNINYGYFHSALTPLHFALLRECKLIVHMLLMARTRPPSEAASRQSIPRSGSLPSLADLASSVQRDGCQTHMRVIESAMEYFTDGIWEELHPPRRSVTSERYGRYERNSAAC